MIQYDIVINMNVGGFGKRLVQVSAGMARGQVRVFFITFIYRRNLATRSGLVYLQYTAKCVGCPSHPVLYGKCRPD